MSKASNYGATVGEFTVQYAQTLARWDDDLATMLGDLICDLLHWAEREGVIGGTGDSCNEADDILDMGLRHFEAERGEGDDLSNDHHYDTITNELRWKVENVKTEPPVYEVFQHNGLWYGVRDGHRTGFGYTDRGHAVESAQRGYVHGGFVAITEPFTPPPDQREPA